MARAQGVSGERFRKREHQRKGSDVEVALGAKASRGLQQSSVGNGSWNGGVEGAGHRALVGPSKD